MWGRVAVPVSSLYMNHPLLRALAIYREMPWRFALVTTLYIAGNLGLVWQQ